MVLISNTTNSGLNTINDFNTPVKTSVDEVTSNETPTGTGNLTTGTVVPDAKAKQAALNTFLVVMESIAELMSHVAGEDQKVLLASLIASWPLEAARWRLLTAFALLVLVDVITYAFHYPRLTVMFKTPLPEDPSPIARAAREWARGNIVRVVLLAGAFLSAIQAVIILARA